MYVMPKQLTFAASVRAVVETAGLALHDEKPKRISRLFDETIADCSFGSGRRWACGKCRQRSLKPPSKPSECRRPLRGDFVFESCVSGTKRIQRHRRAPKHGLSAIPYLLAGKGAFKLNLPQSGREILSRLSILPCRSTTKITASD
jgi:hypothetical protein